MLGGERVEVDLLLFLPFFVFFPLSFSVLMCACVRAFHLCFVFDLLQFFLFLLLLHLAALSHSTRNS